MDQYSRHTHQNDNIIILPTGQPLSVGSRPSSSKHLCRSNGTAVHSFESKGGDYERAMRNSNYSLLKTVVEILNDGTERLKTPVQLIMSPPMISMEIRMRCIFLRVGDIDTLNERYYAEIILEASWNDIQLKDQIAYNHNQHWNPNLAIVNSIGDLQKHDIWYTIQNTVTMTEVTEHHRIKGLFWEKMELSHFPVDVQKLSIQVSTMKQNKELGRNMLKFVKNNNKQSGVNRFIFT
ncbi:unnamed protein product, partial [Didymodactylos carnosus]